MDDLARMLIERACERLVNSYANLIDAYDYDAFLGLWAEDAVMNMMGRELVGPAGIRAWLEARDPTMICRHQVTNIVTEVIDQNRATGFCYTLSYHVSGARGQSPGPLHPPTFFVEYRSEFRRDPKRGWLFARRDVTTPMAGPEQIRALQAGRGK
jgi:ketosteroid isomerase-like protein